MSVGRYDDPMFRHGRAEPGGFDLVRRLADPRPLSPATLAEAQESATNAVHGLLSMLELHLTDSRGHATRVAAHRRDRAGARAGQRDEITGDARDLIAVAHPDFHLARKIGEQFVRTAV